MKISELIAQKAASPTTASRIAVKQAHYALSYAELHEHVVSFASWLRTENPRVVALLADNSIDWLVTDLACERAGIPLLPLPIFFTMAQMDHCLESAGADLLLSDGPRLPAFKTPHKPLADSTPGGLSAHRLTTKAADLPDHTAKITFTSGTTGKPKGVCLSVENQFSVARSLADSIQLYGVAHLCMLPLSTLLENVAGAYATWMVDGCVDLPSSQTRGLAGSSGLNAQQWLSYLSMTQPESMILTPELLLVLSNAAKRQWQPPKSFKFIAVGGSRVAPQLLRESKALGLPVYQGYGLSECGSVVALSTKDTPEDSVGRVLPHVQVRFEATQAVITGNCFLGYLHDPNSWYQHEVVTEDLGHLDGEQLYIDGRSSHLLITSYGRNISPEWVESELMRHGLLRHCVVGGDARPFLHALVTAPAQVSNQMIDRLIHSSNSELPDYARVRAWQRLDEANLAQFYTSNGRPQRAKIKQFFASEIDAFYPNHHTKQSASGVSI